LAGFLAIILGLLWMYFWQQRTRHWPWILAVQVLLGTAIIELAPWQGDSDPPILVLDEFLAAGILVTASRQWQYLLTGAALFSSLDATKPIARYFESLPGGLGIVADDVISATLTAAVLILLE
jgi:phosphatidylglycerophosphatase A